MNDLDRYNFFKDAIINKHFCFQNSIDILEDMGEKFIEFLKEDCNSYHIYDIGACYGIIIYYLNNILNTEKIINFNYIDPVILLNYKIPYRDAEINKNYQTREEIINNLIIQLELNKYKNRKISFYNDYNEINRKVDFKEKSKDIFILEAADKVHINFFKKVLEEGIKKGSFFFLKKKSFYSNILFEYFSDKGLFKKINNTTYYVLKNFSLKNVKIDLDFSQLPIEKENIRTTLDCSIENASITILREKIIKDNIKLNLSFDKIFEIT